MQDTPGDPRRTWLARAGLALVLLLGVFLRVRGLSYGVPYPFHHRPDEEQIVEHAMHMVSTHDLEPGPVNYPGLFKYGAAAALWGDYRWGHLGGRWPSLREYRVDVKGASGGRDYVVCRAVSAAFGAATVLVVFLLARALGGREDAALAAAIFLATAFLHVRDSHFATVDVTMTFFVAVSLLGAVRAWPTAGGHALVLCGVAAGLAAATKYNAAIVLVAGLAACVNASRAVGGPSLRRLLVRVATLGAAAIAGFVVGTPYTLFELGAVWHELVGTQAVLTSKGTMPGFLVHALVTLPQGMGWPVFLLGVLGLVWAGRAPRGPALVVALFAALFYASIGTPTWVMPRYALPLVPALCVLAAGALRALAARVHKDWLVLPIGLVCALPGLAKSIRIGTLMSRPDTRVLATGWVVAHLPSESQIAGCMGYGAPDLPSRPKQSPRYDVQWLRCTPETAAAVPARWLITHEHPFLPWSPAPGEYERVLGTGWRMRAEFDPFASRPPQAAYYFMLDAFYLPFTGLDTVERGGPIVRIWERVDDAGP